MLTLVIPISSVLRFFLLNSLFSGNQTLLIKHNINPVFISFIIRKYIESKSQGLQYNASAETVYLYETELLKTQAQDTTYYFVKNLLRHRSTSVLMVFNIRTNQFWFELKREKITRGLLTCGFDFENFLLRGFGLRFSKTGDLKQIQFFSDLFPLSLLPLNLKNGSSYHGRIFSAKYAVHKHSLRLKLEGYDQWKRQQWIGSMNVRELLRRDDSLSGSKGSTNQMSERK